MTEPAPETTPYPWLPADRVLRWLKITPGSDQAAVAEDLRKVAADYCEAERTDLFVDVLDVDGVTVLDTVFTPPERVIQAGVLCAARLYARVGSPAGIASYGEFGAEAILRIDPDVSRLLEVGPYATPVIG